MTPNLNPQPPLGWPSYLQPPTLPEWREAESRYAQDCKRDIAAGYSGDFLMGLTFVIATYGPIAWIRYFL